ncbi:MAG: DUF5987 family protein [Phycicoccus sp.]
MLTEVQVLTLEALADTVVPGVKRHPEDVAISGLDDSPGAVEAGALEVLLDPATGLENGVGEMADLLNVHALARSSGGPAGTTDATGALAPAVSAASELPSFVALDHVGRRALLAELTAREHPERELWFLMALFCYMAFDSAPHLDTAEAVRDGHPGLVHLGFLQPDADGLWRSTSPTYGRPTARARPGTDEFGNLS